jgi:6-phosphogluconolactonase
MWALAPAPARCAAGAARAAPPPSPGSVRAAAPRPSVAARATRSFVRHSVDAPCDLAVHAYATPEDQAAALCRHFEALAAESIRARGAFTVAVPGGSVLKMLGGLAGSTRVDWSRVVLAYANHKCVPLDADNATHFKARKLFLDAATGVTVLPPGGGADPVAEAAAYEASLRACERLAFDAAGNACFDLMLLGVGADGHVGSLYPGRGEVHVATGAQVLPVQKGSGPGSITLSLPVMNAARKVIMCMAGASKADAVRLCLEERVPAGEFPAQLVTCKMGGVAWLLDAGAASKLAAANGVAALL